MAWTSAYCRMATRDKNDEWKGRVAMPSNSDQEQSKIPGSSQSPDGQRPSSAAPSHEDAPILRPSPLFKLESQTSQTPTSKDALGAPTQNLLQSLFKLVLPAQGTSELLAYIPETPVLVCSTANPPRQTPSKKRAIELLHPNHESIIADARKLWGEYSFPGLGHRVILAVGAAEHTPEYVTQVAINPSAVSALGVNDIRLRLQPQADGSFPQARLIRICTTRIGYGGAIDESAKAHMTIGRGLDSICAQGPWSSTDRLVKICIRPTLAAKFGEEFFPSQDTDVFSLRFCEAFTTAKKKALGEGNGPLRVEYSGLDPLCSPLKPEIKILPYRERNKKNEIVYEGVGISRRDPELEVTPYFSKFPQRYADIITLYGNEEGGWHALQTYDGPKLTFGWAQLTFGPNVSNTKREPTDIEPGDLLTEGWGKNFLSFLACNYEDCFDRLFGVYGYRISYFDENERSCWSMSPAQVMTRFSGADHKKTFFWRLPCCWAWSDARLPKSNIYEPPELLRVRRRETASVGFVGLMVQAFIDKTFEAAMVRWIVGMIDAAYDKAGAGATKEAVTRKLYHIIRGRTMMDEMKEPGSYAPKIQERFSAESTNSKAKEFFDSSAIKAPIKPQGKL